eukprot:gene3161-biopygen11669
MLVGVPDLATGHPVQVRAPVGRIFGTLHMVREGLPPVEVGPLVPHAVTVDAVAERVALERVRGHGAAVPASARGSRLAASPVVQHPPLQGLSVGGEAGRRGPRALPPCLAELVARGGVPGEAEPAAALAQDTSRISALRRRRHRAYDIGGSLSFEFAGRLSPDKRRQLVRLRFAESRTLIPPHECNPSPGAGMMPEGPPHGGWNGCRLEQNDQETTIYRGARPISDPGRVQGIGTTEERQHHDNGNGQRHGLLESGKHVCKPRHGNMAIKLQFAAIQGPKTFSASISFHSAFCELILVDRTPAPGAWHSGPPAGHSGAGAWHSGPEPGTPAPQHGTPALVLGTPARSLALRRWSAIDEHAQLPLRHARTAHPFACWKSFATARTVLALALGTPARSLALRRPSLALQRWRLALRPRSLALRSSSLALQRWSAIDEHGGMAAKMPPGGKDNSCSFTCRFLESFISDPRRYWLPSTRALQNRELLCLLRQRHAPSHAAAGESRTAPAYPFACCDNGLSPSPPSPPPLVSTKCFDTQWHTPLLCLGKVCDPHCNYLNRDSDIASSSRRQQWEDDWG